MSANSKVSESRNDTSIQFDLKAKKKGKQIKQSHRRAPTKK